MNRVLLNNVDHAGVRVAIRAGAAFGDAVNQSPLFPAEFEEAQRSFPIVFRQQEGAFQAFALLGLDRDENLFLDGERWTSSYVPAFQRRGPFAIGIAPPAPGEDAGEPMIHLDLDDPRVGEPDGLPVFREHGGNAPLLTHMIDVLRVIHEGLASGPALYVAWEEAGLLRPITMRIELGEGETYELPDLFAIDRQALADLSGEPLESIHRAGLLVPAVLAAASLGNVQRLIELKTRRAAA